MADSIDFEELLDLADLDALADPADKIDECRFFLKLAEQEEDVRQFRWLISAFFGAAYSYFEICALRAYHSFWDADTGEPLENCEALDVLRKYIRVAQDAKRPMYVKTSGLHKITVELYKLRKGNTHHHPLSILKANGTLPEGFQFGFLKSKGVPALHFCREVMQLIEDVEQQIAPLF